MFKITSFFVALFVFGISFTGASWQNESDCSSLVDQSTIRWSTPLVKIGTKQYYLGIFFKLNWHKAVQYCRYHGMDLASITNPEENHVLYEHIAKLGLGKEAIWLSGTDLGSTGSYYWISTGHPLTFTHFSAGQPDNYRVPHTGEVEHCLQLWNTDGHGYKWNDASCSADLYFACEIN